MNNGYQNNQINNYGEQGEYHSPQQSPNTYYPQQPYVEPVQQGKKKKRLNFPKVNWSKFIVKAVLLLVIGVGVTAFDGNKEDKLIGTWTYSYEMKFDDGVVFEVTENLIFTDGHYNWELDEEKTKASLMTVYESEIIEEGITEDDVVLLGYASVQDFKEEMVDLEYERITDYIGSENSGTWRIEKGQFIFTREGTTEQLTTDYKLDGDTLELVQDGITLTRVEDVQ